MDWKKIATGTAIIGAINWGLVGLLNLDLIKAIPFVKDYANIVYIIIGVAGVYAGYLLVKK